MRIPAEISSFLTPALYIPVVRWEGDLPEAWRRSHKFHCNLGWSRKILFHIYNATFLLFAARRILNEELLLGRYLTCQSNERTMSVDRQCLRSLEELGAFFRGSVNDNRNTPLDPQAAAFLEPSSRTSGHTNEDMPLLFCLGKKCEIGISNQTTRNYVNAALSLETRRNANSLTGFPIVDACRRSLR